MSGSRWTKLAASARGALFNATDLAESRGADEIRTEHLLGGVLTVADPVVSKALEGCGVSAEALRGDLTERLPPPVENRAEELPLSAQSRAALDAAISEARALKHYDATAAHLLLGLALSRDATARVLLATHGVRPDRLRAHLAELIPALQRPPARPRQLDEA